MTGGRRAARAAVARTLSAVVLAGCGADGITPPPTGGEWPGFRDAVSYASGGTGLVSLAATDGTGDGRVDLLTVASGQAVHILPATGGGAFGTPTTHAAGSDPRYALAGDVNGDARPDLVVIGHFDNAFFVRLGTGDGQFAGATSYALRNHGRRVAIAHLNGDGYADVIAVHDGSGQPVYVTAFLGSATGTMRKVWEAATPYVTSRDIAVGDFDGDGRRDFVVATGDHRTGLVVFRGLGTGEFGPPEALPPLPQPTPGASDGTEAVAANDVNGDGLADLVVAHDTYVDGVAVHLSTGAGFAAPTVLTGVAPRDVVLADVDGDGRVDAVLAELEDGTVAVMPGTATGSFGPPRRFPVGTTAVSLAAADFDGDGRIDVAVTDILDHRVRVLLNR